VSAAVNGARTFLTMVVLDVKVVPRSKKRCVSLEGDLLTIKLTSPPEKGKANEELIKLLRHALKREVRILSGHTARRKRISVEGDIDEIKALLSTLSCRD
jgi:uncharacterized protein (TIGR00251 family)